MSNVFSGRQISSPQTSRSGDSRPFKEDPCPKAFVGPGNMIQDFNSACLPFLVAQIQCHIQRRSTYETVTPVYVAL